MTSTRTGARSRLARRLSWLAVVSLVSAALFAPSVSPVLAAGPGDNGSGWPDGGPKSDATVGGDASAVAGGASMNSAKMYCNGDSANHFSGSIDVTKDFDSGSEIVVYLAANNGSNASPAANVSKNYAVIPVSDAGTYPFTLDITSGFTSSAGGILIVFAVNQDGTVISSSKSNSLNCTEAESTPTPAPTATPKPTETPAPTQTPAPTETPKPTETPAPTQTPAPTETPKPTYTPHPTETPAPTQTPAPTEKPKDQASILIAKVDDNGTETQEDDTLLDGAKFKVYADDGDGQFDPNDDELVFGPETAADGMLDTDLLDEGMYWIVESTVPSGFVGSHPILVELNTDPSKTCIWDAQGLIDCVSNDGEGSDLSLTIVVVNNSPKSEPAPTGDVAPATGKPRATLPATDTLDAASSAPTGDNWRIVLLAMAGLLTAGLMLTPGRSVVRRENDAR